MSRFSCWVVMADDQIQDHPLWMALGGLSSFADLSPLQEQVKSDRPTGSESCSKWTILNGSNGYLPSTGLTGGRRVWSESEVPGAR